MSGGSLMASNASKRGRNSKASTKANNTRTSKNKADNSNSKSSELRDEIIILFTFAFAIILLLSNFRLAGSIGNGINWFMFGLVGIIEYILPIIILISVLFLIANKQIGVVKVKTVAVYVLTLLLCGFVQLIMSIPIKSNSVGAFFTYSSEKKMGGGFIGGLLCKVLSPLGIAGSYVILIICIIICIILITEKSFIKGVTNGGSKVYKSAKEDYANYKEHSVERRQEREKELEKEQEEAELDRIQRMDNKVKGVALDTIIPKESTSKNTDLHEISMDFDKQDEFSNDIYDPDLEPIDINSEENEFIDNSDSVEHTRKRPKRSRIKNFEANEAISEAQEQLQQESIATSETAIEDGTDRVNTHSSNTKTREYVFPPISLLDRNVTKKNINQNRENNETAARLVQTLQNFGVKVTITNISCGPSVTRYEIQPEQGVKVSKIVSLSDDIKLNLAAADIRIEAPIPGKAAVGIEVPNKETTGVMLRELLESDPFTKHPSAIAFAAGRDIAGQIIIADIAKMPHLLIAGATGSGKSVCINTIIMSILYKSDPEDVKLIMIDPKVVELSVYNGIPHLMIPVVTDPKKAAGALNWAVAEMTDRYNKFAEQNVRDLKGYNETVSLSKDTDEETRPKKMPEIVIIIDELADLMMVAPGEVEEAICRLAQLARAAGIHLVIATQRPSVNVITGLIKANVPSRIAFSVSSGVDSRTIIDMNGAEKLLGKGDMLFYPSGYPKPVRVQGTFVSDKEVGRVVKFMKEHIGDVVYNQEVSTKIESASMSDSQAFGNERDAYFAEAGKFIIEKEKGSIGMLQRYYKIGFNRAARIMDQLADAGIVGPEEGTKPRKILMTIEEFEEFLLKNSLNT